MNQSVEFDESNHVLMQKVAEQIALVIPEVFPPYLDLRDRTKNNADKESEQEIRLSIQLAHQVSISEIRPYLDLLITNLGSMYEAIDGPDWTKDKIYEMAEPGLIYVAYKKYDTIVAYISVKLVKEYDAKALFIRNSRRSRISRSKPRQEAHALSRPTLYHVTIPTRTTSLYRY